MKKVQEEKEKTEQQNNRRYIWPHLTLWMFLGLLGGLLMIEYATWEIVIVMGVIWLWLASGRKFFRDGILLMALFFLVGLGLSLQLQQTEAAYRALPTQEGTIIGIVTDHRDDSGYLRVQIQSINERNTTSSGRATGKELPEVRLLLSGRKADREVLHVILSEGQENQHWYPRGTVVEIRGTIMQPETRRNPGGFDEAAWLRGNGIYQVLRADSIILQKTPTGINGLAAKLRLGCNDVLQSLFHENEQALIRAILFGEKYRLDDRFYMLTQQLGIAHVFAVSGLHVGFLSGMILLILRLFRLERGITGMLMTGAFLYGYVLLTGFSPSVMRASGMLMLALCGAWLLRPVVPIDYLAFCGLVLLLYRPQMLWTAGFQLSFGVTAALLLFAVPLQQMLEKRGFPRKAAAALAVVLASWMGSAPFMAKWFYGISVISPVANLCLIPLFSIGVPMTAALLCMGMAGLPGVHVAALPVHWILRAMSFLPEWMNSWMHRLSIPLQWNTGELPWVTFVLWMAAMMILWMLLHNSGRETMSAVGRPLLALCLTAVLTLCLSQSPERNRITWLYAGQGSSAVVQTRHGEVFVFDCGSARTELLSLLRWMGVNRIDGVILSHGDSDHITGLFPVAESIRVKKIYGIPEELDRIRSTWQEQGGFRTPAGRSDSEAEAYGINFFPVDTAGKLTLQGAGILLYPLTETMGDSSRRRNENQLAAAFFAGDSVVAFPGDAEGDKVMAFADCLPKVSVWTVPHHGSRGAGSAQLYGMLQKKGVKVAVISAGVGNRYGHPHEEVLQWITDAGIPCHRTDREGAISIEI